MADTGPDYGLLAADADRMAERAVRDDPRLAQTWRELADTYRMLAAQIDRLNEQLGRSMS
jgi:hypothetical protein